MFTDVLDNAGAVEEKLLGPNYQYWANINSPGQMGMSETGSLEQLGYNISGLVSYAEVLASGSGNASKTGSPLGNKFFLQTGGQCTDTKTNNKTDRYIYVNNIPTGKIPFVSSLMGANTSSAKGLIPGIMEDLNVLNPFAIMQSFMMGANPACQEVTMQTVDVNNNTGNESHFVTVVDLQNMNPCWFDNKTNPITNIHCSEGFETLHPQKIRKHMKQFRQYDTVSQAYLLLCGIFILYMICCVALKQKG